MFSLFLFLITSDDTPLIKHIIFYLLANYTLPEVTETLPQLQELIQKGILDESQKGLVKCLMDCIAQCNQVQKSTAKLQYQNSLRSLIRLSTTLCTTGGGSHNLLRDYLRLREDSALSDFTLEYQSDQYALHTNMLFASSAFFQTMFSF